MKLDVFVLVRQDLGVSEISRGDKKTSFQRFQHVGRDFLTISDR